MRDRQHGTRGADADEPLAVVDLSDAYTDTAAQDHELAAAFRRALTAGAPESMDVEALLAGVRRRARRLHRRRTATAVGCTLVAAAAVVAVVPQLGTGTPSSSASRPVAGSSATDGAQPSQPTTQELTERSLLRTQDINAFGPAVLSDPGGITVGPGGEVITGVCTDAALDVDPASSSAQADWSVVSTVGSASTPQPTSTVGEAGVVERMWRFQAPGQASAALDQLEAQVPSCAGAGKEGHGPTELLDTGLLVVGRALATSASDGNGARLLSYWTSQEDTLILLQFTYTDTISGTVAWPEAPAGSGPAALAASSETAWNAIDRAAAW